MLSKFIKFLGSHSTSMAIGRSFDYISKESDTSLTFRICAVGFCFLFSVWTQFYDANGRYWIISRPKYVVTGYTSVIDAVAGGPGGRRSRVEFFTALAQYLANKTKTLSFLDAASCGEDKEDGMPSWVPNWTREVGDPAFDFATLIKKDHAPDTFWFPDDGKTLQLLGLFRGKVHKVRSKGDLAILERTAPWEAMFDRYQALPEEWKAVVKSGFEIISTDAGKRI